jgi:predicted permease
MDWTLKIRDAAARAGGALDPDVVDELAAHAQSAYDAACARGATVDEAHTHVTNLIRVWIANPDSLNRPARRAPAIEPPTAGSRRLASLAQDLRYAMRLTLRQRGFSLVAIATMAVAIGVMTTLVSVVYSVLMRPLPWADPDRLVRLTETHAGATRQMPLSMTSLSYLPWLDSPSTIEAIGAWQGGTPVVAVNGSTDRVTTASVTPSVFPLLRVTPLLGSVFTRDDAPDVLISFGFWQQRFGGDPAALGQMMKINGQPYTIVGVMPADFLFPDRDTQLWRPFQIRPVVDDKGRAFVSMFSAMARLQPGATPEAAAAEATARAQNAPKEAGPVTLAIFGSMGAAQVSALPALDALTHEVAPGLVVLLIAVTLLLVTAVANIAGLQLARATTRYREMAIRSAIGAGTSRLAQQLMVENLWLAAVGGAVGIGLSALLHRALPSLLPADFPRVNDIRFGWTVAMAAIAITALTGLALGALPALHLARLRLAGALSEGAAGAIGGTRVRARTVMMTAQIATTCALLIVALLLTRSFMAMTGQDRGFEPSRTLTARLTLPDFAFKPAQRLDALRRFLDLARALPGHPTVALTTGLPLSGSENLSAFDMPSVQHPGTDVQAHAVRSVVTPDVFAALGLRLAQGRAFRPEEDSATAAKVVLVNQTFARQYLTDHPVGDRIQNFMQGDAVPYEVIGVVDDMIRNGLRDQTQPEIYSLLAQSPGPATTHEVVLKTTGDPQSLTQPLRSLVRQLSPDATLGSVLTMDERIAASLARNRLYAVVLVAFGISALAITAVGLFGVLSYSVAQRTREIAVRSALGARPRQIFGLVITQGVIVTIAGLAIGAVAAGASTKYLTTLLYGVSSHDVVTFLAVGLVMIAIALVACFVPALRAMRVDPLTALRA